VEEGDVQAIQIQRLQKRHKLLWRVYTGRQKSDELNIWSFPAKKNNITKQFGNNVSQPSFSYIFLILASAYIPAEVEKREVLVLHKYPFEVRLVRDVNV